MGTDSETGGSGGRVRGIVFKALVLFGGVLLFKRLRRSMTRWDHARAVAQALSGEKYSREQAYRDPDNYFNLRMLTCPATDMIDGSRVLYFEQAFWRTQQKPFRQRFYIIKPCPKETKCDVELSSYAIRDTEEYKNFCDRPKDQRPHDEEIIGDIAEHLTTISLSQCERGKRCLYEGSTTPGGFPSSWVWGPMGGPYEFKPAPNSSHNDIIISDNVSATKSLEKKKKIDGSFVLNE